MKKALAFILSLALIMSALVFPTATLVSAETDSVEAELSFSGTSTVYNSGSAIRTKVLKDGTVAAVYYKGGIYYATSTDGGITFKNDVQLIENATDSELAKSEEVTTQTTLAKEYVEKYGEFGRGRLEAQNPNLIELDNGNIMVFYRYNTYTTEPDNKPWSIYYASICYQILDKETGKWSDVQVMVETEREKELNDSADYGFWEPDPVYITDQNGNTNLFVYYADTATPKNLSYQNIMYCVWDGEGFSKPATAQNGTEHQSRDGMSVVTKLSNGTYAMVFESTKTGSTETTFVIKMSFSEDGKSWTNPVVVAKPDISIKDNVTADGITEYAVCASPYVVTLPDGRLAVSYQTTDRYTGKTPDRVSYRVGTQVAISSQVITSDTFKDYSENDDFTAYFTNKYNPGTLGENEFSRSAGLMVNGDYLYVYYNHGSNTWDEQGKITHNKGTIDVSYMQLPKADVDYNDLDNYIVYQASSTGTAPTDDEGKITIAAGNTTNLIAAEKETQYVIDTRTAVSDLYSVDNYTTHGTADYTVTIGESSIATNNKQTKSMLNNTAYMTDMEAEVTIQGNDKGSIYAGIAVHIQPDDFTKGTFNTSGYSIFVKRNSETGLNAAEIHTRYCVGGSSKYEDVVTMTTALDSADIGLRLRLFVAVYGDDIVIKLFDSTGATQYGETLTYPLDYTTIYTATECYESGAVALITNGAHTFTDLEVYDVTTSKTDAKVMTQATDLKAHGVFTMLETPNTMYAGFDFRVQQAAAATRGINGYSVKLLQSSDTAKLKLEFTRYGINSSGDAYANLGSIQGDISSILTDGTSAGAKIIMDAIVKGETLTVTVTNYNDTAKTATATFDLTAETTYANVTYDTYYERGGFGIYKHGTGTITVEDVEFTVLPVEDVNNIDESLYTLYTPEGSTGLTVEDEAFVSAEAVAKKAILKDAAVTDFSADATYEIGSDGGLKAGIIFRAQNVGNGTDDMEGYSVVLYKTPNASNNSCIIMYLYKWGRTADGSLAYLGPVNSMQDHSTLFSAYPDTVGNKLAAAGIKVKLYVSVEGDNVTASFDVLDDENRIAASSDTATFALTPEEPFAKEADATTYNAGAIGLSISSKGKICDFNVDYDEYGQQLLDADNFTYYSSNKNTFATLTDETIYSKTGGYKRLVDWSKNINTFKMSSTFTVYSESAPSFGFDFGLDKNNFNIPTYADTENAGSANVVVATADTQYNSGYRVTFSRRTATDHTNDLLIYLNIYTSDGNGGYTSENYYSTITDFFKEYYDANDNKYKGAEIDVVVSLDKKGTLVATASLVGYTATGSYTKSGLSAFGSYGFYMSNGGTLSNTKVFGHNESAYITAADCINGSVYAAINSGAAKVGDDVKIVPVADDGYRVDTVYTNVSGEATEITKTESGYVFAKEYGATEISATFFMIGDIYKDGKVDGVDITCLRKDLLEAEDYDAKYTDVNGDEAVNIKDLVRIKKIAVEITE